MLDAPLPGLAQESGALSGPLPTPDQRRQMAALAADFTGAFDVPGLSIAVVIKGKPAYVEAFGVADRETSEALTPQHRFRIASISKPVTSAGIFTLVEAGKLRFTDYVFGPERRSVTPRSVGSSRSSWNPSDEFVPAIALKTGRRRRNGAGRMLVYFG
jgi:hypothetical protein